MLSFHNHSGLKIRTLMQLHKSLTYRDMGIPSILEVLKKVILENLDNKSAKEFPIQFIEAMPVGVDLSGVYYKWAVRLLKRVRGHANDDNKVIIDRAIELLEKPEGVDENDNIELIAANKNGGIYIIPAIASNAVCAAKAKNTPNDIFAFLSAVSYYTASCGGSSERIKQRDDLLELLREVGNE